jgi:Alpha/beta hydrolase of unknown function (DUF900).
LVGGPVTRVAAAWPEHWMSGHGEVVLLIHGYNNVKRVALRSYNKVFTRSFPRTGHVFWPGDIKGGQLISAPSYPWQILHAREAAARLADYFHGVIGPNGAPVLITLIAHSLGCRLVFELLRDLANNPSQNVRFRLICLMAAAVPTRLIELDRVPPSKLEGVGRRVLVFHSVCDGVLLFAFRGGQFAAWKFGFENEYYPDAVGREGAPFLVGERCHLEGAAHGDYWPSKKIANEIALQLGIARPRPLVSRLESGRRSLLRRFTPSRYFR